ncbi:MAG: redoxin domain-containing protein [Armatimonadota bacterium]
MNVIIIALLAAIIIVTGCGREDPTSPAAASEPAAQTPEATATDAAPAFQLTDIDGERHSLGEYRGDIVVLYFWATYCIPCCDKLEKMPAMQEAYSPRGVHILALSADPSPQIVSGWEQEHDVDIPLIALSAEENKGQDVRGKYFPDKKILPLPQAVIIGPEGDILQTMGSELTLESLEAEIKTALKQTGR